MNFIKAFIILFIGWLILPPGSFAQVSQTKYVRVTHQREALLFPSEQFHFDRHLGNRIDDCIEHGIKKADIGELVEPFKHRTETHLWQSEFWGKWMLSAAKAYHYKADAQLMTLMKQSVNDLIRTQSEDGYIGNYTPAARLAEWDIWGSKYTLLGLIYYYDITGEKRVLAAARSLADNVLRLIGPEKANIVRTGNYRGMASSSILEPVILLYERTGDRRYLDFANYIVKQWDTPDGPQLITKAIGQVPVSERFTKMKTWWGWDNGQKAYEMMSCYDGLLKLYQLTGEQTYLQAVIDVVQNIREEEINIVGSGSAFECWYKGKEKQTLPVSRGMETCVTTTWLKLSYELYRFTGNPECIEEIEKSAYNHLLGALMPGGDRFSKYSSLEGYRDPDGYQCDMHINCCMANGPRGLLALQDLALMHDNKDIFVNLYNQGKGTLRMNTGQTVEVELAGRYPEDGDVTIRIRPEQEKAFDMNLRIPSWATSVKVFVNSTEFKDAVQAGTYLKLSRTWKTNDSINVRFNMKGRITRTHDGVRKYVAFQWGPLVLAQDSRFGKYGVDEAIQVEDSNVNDIILQPYSYAEDSSAGSPHRAGKVAPWLGFKTRVLYGLGENARLIDIPLADYSSAGNAWDPGNRFRVWIPLVYNAEKDRLPSRP